MQPSDCECLAAEQPREVAAGDNPRKATPQMRLALEERQRIPERGERQQSFQSVAPSELSRMAATLPAVVTAGYLPPLLRSESQATVPHAGLTVSVPTLLSIQAEAIAPMRALRKCGRGMRCRMRFRTRSACSVGCFAMSEENPMTSPMPNTPSHQVSRFPAHQS